MAILYDYDPEKQTVTVRPLGVLSVSDITDYLISLSTDPDVGTVRTEIVLFEGVTDFTITYSGMNAVLETMKGRYSARV